MKASTKKTTTFKFTIKDLMRLLPKGIRDSEVKFQLGDAEQNSVHDYQLSNKSTIICSIIIEE